MKGLEPIIDKIETYIDDKDQTREKSIRYSRNIIINCRKAIHQIHQHQYHEAETFIRKAGSTLGELYQITKSYPDLTHAGYVENASQEYVEANCFYQLMQENDLPDPDELHTSYTSYLQGLCDVVGELRRKTLDSILEGEPEEAKRYLSIMEDIYESIIRFDYPSGLIPIKRKQDVARSLVEKTRGELAVATCEYRIGHKTDEIQEAIGTVKAKKGKKQKISGELDLDRVW